MACILYIHQSTHGLLHHAALVIILFFFVTCFVRLNSMFIQFSVSLLTILLCASNAIDYAVFQEAWPFLRISFWSIIGCQGTWHESSDIVTHWVTWGEWSSSVPNGQQPAGKGIEWGKKGREWRRFWGGERKNIGKITTWVFVVVSASDCNTESGGRWSQWPGSKGRWW